MVISFAILWHKDVLVWTENKIKSCLVFWNANCIFYFVKKRYKRFFIFHWNDKKKFVWLEENMHHENGVVYYPDKHKYLHWTAQTFGIFRNKMFCNIKKKMWYDCQWDNYPQKTKMTQPLTTIGHRTAFNNEQWMLLCIWSIE